jgi:hypothetical protein
MNCAIVRWLGQFQDLYYFMLGPCCEASMGEMWETIVLQFSV